MLWLVAILVAAWGDLVGSERIQADSKRRELRVLQDTKDCSEQSRKGERPLMSPLL
jgi:hypothetical protein